VGVIPYVGGIAEVCQRLHHSHLGLAVVSGQKSLHLELDLWYDGVLDIVSLLEVSCLETQLGGSMWRSSGACHCPRLIFKGAMYAIASEFKTMAFLGPTKTRHLLVVSFTPQG
jgi:hypothetical protein